jgi:hypothetical protein
MAGRRRLVAALALATAAATGCSFLAVKPSAVVPLDAAACTDDYLWPALDVLGSAAAATATMYAAQRGSQTYPDGVLDKEAFVIGYGVGAIFYGGSAAAGFSRVHACREAKAVLTSAAR